MTFDLTPTAAQHDLAKRTHAFAESVIRPVALDYDQRHNRETGTGEFVCSA
ncbi:MAG: hypothetical protein JO259_03755 [Mycobacterium sp.]|nr:hypothetical protein [Mycobacterium sp.]